MIWIGTSGYNFPEWRGSFYPAGLPDAKMLPYYAERFATVEINYTFYRIPNYRTLDGWLAATPERFRFTLKAPKRITHAAKLRECGEVLGVFCDRARRLGDRLGALLFQLPGTFRKDVEALDGLLEALPGGFRPAFEFRSRTWFAEEVYDCLRRHEAALCVADSETLTTPLVRTAPFTYFRLRDEGYDDAELDVWTERVVHAASEGEEVFVYFKHEAEGMGAVFGRGLLDRLRAQGAPLPA
jgi:uncharacterized protein YecE (DUF72 family)